MTATIHEVSGELRSRAFDERDKGDKFEGLVASYLRTNPEWPARVSDVTVLGSAQLLALMQFDRPH